MLDSNYIDEVRLFLKECKIDFKENNKSKYIDFLTHRYIIKCCSSHILIYGRLLANLIDKSEDLNIFKINIMYFEGYFNDTKRIIELYDEVKQLTNIYDQLYRYNRYYFVFVNDVLVYYRVINYIKTNQIHPINYNPFEAIPYLKTKIDEIENALYEPNKGKEYFYLEQLFETILE